MKLVLESKEEEKLIRRGSISIDELLILINQNDFDRNLQVVVDVEAWNNEI